MAKGAILSGRQANGTVRGDDPPYPPMSVRAGLIAKTAIVSGPPAPTKNAAYGYLLPTGYEFVPLPPPA